MIWEDKLQFITAQGPLFMAAAVSVTLGLTLLVVSAVLRIGALRRMIKARPARRSKTAGPAVRATDIGYEATGPLPAAAPATTADPSRLADLHRRLSVAADRLEALRDAENEGFVAGGISSLKGMGPAVEYLKKTEAVQ